LLISSDSKHPASGHIRLIAISGFDFERAVPNLNETRIGVSTDNSANEVVVHKYDVPRQIVTVDQTKKVSGSLITIDESVSTLTVLEETPALIDRLR
jgi:hypothetical protein